ncbi:MAG: hypothetical protein AAF713_05910 [Pseudomonadota bacterium]
MAIILVLGAILTAFFFMPCPDPTPPPGILASASATWSGLVYIACGIYFLLPVQSFQFWSFWLPIGLGLAMIFAFLQIGANGHALFLVIHLVISVTYAVIFGAVLTLIREAAEIPSWVSWVAAPLVAFIVPAWATVQAIGFSQDFC